MAAPGELGPAVAPVRRGAAIALLVAVAAVSLCRTVRAPNDWAEAHWLLDYRFGFVKRGLPGQLLTWVGQLVGAPVTAAGIAAIAWVLLAAAAGVVLALALRTAARDAWRPATVAVAAALLSSTFAVQFGHLSGYYDHLFLPLGVASCWLAQRGRIWPAALLQVVALLVHESCALLTVPSFWLAWWLRPRAQAGAERAALHPALLVPVAMAAVMAVVLSSPPAGFEAAFTAHLRAAGFVQGGMDENVPKMLGFSLPTMWTLVTSFGEPRRYLFAALLVAPTLLVLLPALAARAPDRPRRLERLVCYGSVFAPLPMLAVAWDVERISAYTLWLALVALWLRAEARTAPIVQPRWLLPGAVAALVANLLLATPLLDGEHDRLSFGVRIVLAVVFAAGLGARALRAHA
ncbi:MAG: hypothetical protein JNL08_00465 [Planctomycetes bacterium]|nr:hypothetical protein [Planctomycetota bacterium]